MFLINCTFTVRWSEKNEISMKTYATEDGAMKAIKAVAGARSVDIAVKITCKPAGSLD